MRQQHRGGVGAGAGRRGDDPGLLTRAVDRVFRFVSLAEFEILFVLFFLVAFLLFKDLELIYDYLELKEQEKREKGASQVLGAGKTSRWCS